MGSLGMGKAGRAHVHVSPLVDRFAQRSRARAPGLEGLVLAAARAEGDDGELGLVDQLERGQGPNRRGERLRQLELLLERCAKGRGTVQLERQPHAEASEVAAEFGAVFGGAGR